MVRKIFLASVIIAACGPNAADVPFLREAGDPCPVGGCVDASFSLGDGGPITIPPEPLEDWDGADAGGPLSGIFAVKALVTARSGIEVPVTQLYRLRILQNGTQIRQKTTLCEIDLPSIPNVVTLSIPQSLQTLISSRSTESTGNYLSNASVLEAIYSPPPFLQVFGASLANPATDPLPTLDGGATTDDDNDGNPGVTLIADTIACTSVQELFVALRVSGTLGGTVETADVIKGFAQLHLDESVVGFSDPCLSVAAMIGITLDPNSPFRAERVGSAQDIDQNGNVSCPEIVINADTLFPDGGLF